jgi:hypothetical protein
LLFFAPAVHAAPITVEAEFLIKIIRLCRFFKQAHASEMLSSDNLRFCDRQFTINNISQGVFRDNQSLARHAPAACSVAARR